MSEIIEDGIAHVAGAKGPDMTFPEAMELAQKAETQLREGATACLWLAMDTETINPEMDQTTREQLLRLSGVGELPTDAHIPAIRLGLVRQALKCDGDFTRNQFSSVVAAALDIRPLIEALPESEREQYADVLELADAQAANQQPSEADISP